MQVSPPVRQTARTDAGSTGRQGAARAARLRKVSIGGIEEKECKKHKFQVPLMGKTPLTCAPDFIYINIDLFELEGAPGPL